MTDLDELERLLAGMTQGPYTYTFREGSMSEGEIFAADDECIAIVLGQNYARWRDADDCGDSVFRADAAGITNLLNAAPAMIAELKALRRALEYLSSFGCPKCGGDCSSANPPVMMCPMLEAKAALAPSRRATALNELIASTADEYGVQNNGTD